MGRRNRSPEEQARREKIRELLQLSNVSSIEGFNRQLRKVRGNPKYCVNTP